MFQVFAGHDKRAPVQDHVLRQTMIDNASIPFSYCSLNLDTLPMTRRGLTEFTYSRFLVPYLMGYSGVAMFCDSDVIVQGDIAELAKLVESDASRAVWVRRSPWAFEHASVMLFNCGHPANRILTPDYVDDPNICRTPHTIDWCDPDLVGGLPAEWNHIVLYDKPSHKAKLIHFTGGVPLFPETAGCEYSHEFMEAARRCMATVEWQALMGNSVHRDKVAEFVQLRDAKKPKGQAEQ